MTFCGHISVFGSLIGRHAEYLFCDTYAVSQVVFSGKKTKKNTYIRKSLTKRDRGQRGFWQRMWDIVALYDVNLITITWSERSRHHGVRNKTWQPDSHLELQRLYLYERAVPLKRQPVSDTWRVNVCKMRLVVVLASLLVCCLANKPRHCCK